MKICVTVSEGSLDAEIEEEFGHSPLFICVDPETMVFTVHDNVLQETDVGYGIQTAENLIKLGADVVITGFIGPHGVKKLTSKNIRVVADEEGTVREAIERYNRRHPKTP
jgi:predicted Fe-Mo cluster-binding NifX family protein